jgi:hypothetical protein
MYFEIREELRKPALGRVYLPMDVSTRCREVYFRHLQPHGGERGHTCGDNAGTRWEVVMSKIESWL